MKVRKCKQQHKLASSQSSRKLLHREYDDNFRPQLRTIKVSTELPQS